MKVLIVDDDPRVRWFTAVVLEALGHVSAIEASDGASAVASAAAHRPDVIVLDVEMPEMDGPQTLARLRAHPPTADIPVIFFGDPGKRKQLMALGAEGVLDQSLSPALLVEFVLDTLGRARTRAFNRLA